MDGGDWISELVWHSCVYYFKNGLSLLDFGIERLVRHIQNLDQITLPFRIKDTRCLWHNDFYLDLNISKPLPFIEQYVYLVSMGLWSIDDLVKTNGLLIIWFGSKYLNVTNLIVHPIGLLKQISKHIVHETNWLILDENNSLLKAIKYHLALRFVLFVK